MKRFLLALALMLACVSARATQTENIGIHVLPAPGKVVIDGKADDWDLSGGVFACDNVEDQRETYGVWLHAMYDADNLYILAHFVDPTPLNNSGQVGADFGFQGDSLQIRMILAAGTLQENIVHITGWQGRGGADEITFEYGQSAKGRRIENVKPLGAQQAFQKDADGKGYTQEIAIPWKLLTKDGQSLRAGDSLQMTFEPNFTVGLRGRLTVKDVFKEGMSLDRVFTFSNSSVWGKATLESKGHEPLRPVHLSDGRDFPVKLEDDKLVANWNGLIKVDALPGFKKIKFTMPEDGFISLNIKNAEGKVVCQLLRSIAFERGEHEVNWDALTTPNWNVPGQPVPAGEYSWSAIFHKNIGLKLRGWADNAGNVPWDNGSSTNWGGDEGVPTCCAGDAGQVYLGWGCAEAGAALVATDLEGNVRWKNKRAGISGVKGVAADAGLVFVLGGRSGSESAGGNVYTLDAKTGDYAVRLGGNPDIYVRGLWPDPTGKSNVADSIAAKDGKFYLSFTKDNAILVIDAKSHQCLKSLSVPAPGSLCAITGKVFAISSGSNVVAVNPDSGEVKTITDGLMNATALSVDKDGLIYVGERDPDNQVKVFSLDGKFIKAIGRKGKRAASGPWVPDAMAFIIGQSIDANGRLWVAEASERPKRIVTWDTKTGGIWKEFFGPADYGAVGGAINPVDPDLMVGAACEWRLDSETGRARLLGVVTANGQMFTQRDVTKQGLGSARFGVGSNGKIYLAMAKTGNRECPVWIFERVGDGDYKLRASLDVDPITREPLIWSDENGDGQIQENEVTRVKQFHLAFGGWYVAMTRDLTFYVGNGARKEGTLYQLKVSDFTTCNAPKYDIENAKSVSGITGLGSTDGSRILVDGGGEHGWFNCVDTATGETLWTFPDTYVGVHGSHNAPPPRPGLIEGAYGIVGAATLPAPVGRAWIIGTNVGEWHMLTEDGFYLTRLFQPDPLKVTWPPNADPGADMSNCPPGGGGEDFGGSIMQTGDGTIYVQSGKTAFWNMEITGLNTVTALPGGKINVTDEDVKQAQQDRDTRLQSSAGIKRLVVHKITPVFTGKLDADFKGAEIATYQKTDETRTRSAIAYDDTNLYLAWEVQDTTPWINGATAPENMYIGGDTVDFQLGADAKANPKRDQAALGDLRLSIGNFKGAPTAVIYRKVATEKHAKTFGSGIVQSYTMDSVIVANNVNIKVAKSARSYVVEAAVPLSTLGLHPGEALKLPGDFGVTFGDPAGQRTRLRSHWSNQHTGIVDDAVYELMMEPKNWGELIFIK